MGDVIYRSAEGSCPEGMPEICFGCPAQDLVEQISAEPDYNEAKRLAEFFSNALEAAKEVIAKNPNASQKEIDQQMGEFGPQAQDGMVKRHGNLDKSQIAIMAKNCSIAVNSGRCLKDIAAAREKRSQKTS